MFDGKSSGEKFEHLREVDFAVLLMNGEGTQPNPLPKVNFFSTSFLPFSMITGDINSENRNVQTHLTRPIEQGLEHLP